ncbi:MULTISPECIES: hypothetical protein [Nocardia]|uniref:hypothetical protein n=1 Tax=Nocardia TaxID=1817 RepID=UPI0007A52065|nr:hypothetical protein [Nocardia pseudovaccinii]
MPVAFGIAARHPSLLTAAQDSFLSGLSVACVVVAALCYAAAGLVALPGRRFRHALPAGTDRSNTVTVA